MSSREFFRSLIGINLVGSPKSSQNSEFPDAFSKKRHLSAFTLCGTRLQFTPCMGYMVASVCFTSFLSSCQKTCISTCLFSYLKCCPTKPISSTEISFLEISTSTHQGTQTQFQAKRALAVRKSSHYGQDHRTVDVEKT